MSTCVFFRSRKRLTPDIIFNSLVKRGERIIITAQEFPCLKFGTLGEALRGIEINHEKGGYEVRICSFANRADLHLFAHTVEAMTDLTGAKGIYDGDDETIIDNPGEFFSDEWINHQLEASINVNCALVKHFGQPVIMTGLFFPFCFGPRVAQEFGISLREPTVEDLEVVQDHFTDVQWEFRSKKDTSSSLMMGNPDEDERRLSLSMIYVKEKKVAPFELVTYADLVCLMDMDKHKPVVVKMEDFCKIAPGRYFTLIDDYQLECKRPLSLRAFNTMCKLAERYTVEDLFYRPTFPGNGYDEHQRTFVLMWNPAISSVTLAGHASSIPHVMTDSFNWSVYEHREARKGDRFVMVRCGEGHTGLVMSGIFDSNPYQGEDWSGKGREVYYMDLRPNFIADPERASIITTEELTRAVPSFDWTGGHSGRRLTEEQARRLEALLSPYLAKQRAHIDCETLNAYHLPQGGE